MGIDPLISAAIITRDEETLIERCIGSIVDFVDEIVVYDTGSSDRTVELARAAGGRGRRR